MDLYRIPTYRYVRPLRDTGIKRSGTDLRPRGAKRRGRLRPPFLLPPFRLSVRYMYASLPHTNTTRARWGAKPLQDTCTFGAARPHVLRRQGRRAPRVLHRARRRAAACRCRATAPRPAETLRPGVRVRDSFGWCGRKRQDGQVCTAKRSVTPSILCSLNGRTYL